MSFKSLHKFVSRKYKLKWLKQIFCVNYKDKSSFIISIVCFRSLGSNPYAYGVSWRKYSVEEDNFVTLKTPLNPSDYYKYNSDIGSLYRISLWNELLPTIKNITAPPHLVKNGIKGMQLSTGMFIIFKYKGYLVNNSRFGMAPLGAVR